MTIAEDRSPVRPQVTLHSQAPDELGAPAPVAAPRKESARSAAAQDALRRASRPLAAVRAQPNAPVYAGVLLATVGAVLLAVAWGRTAGTTVVSQQIPYVVSAGFAGLALIALGLTVINLSAKARDARERTRQLGELREVLGELRRAVEAQDDVPAPAAPAAPRRRQDRS